MQAALASCASDSDDDLIRDLLVEEGQDVGIFGMRALLPGTRSAWTAAFAAVPASSLTLRVSRCVQESSSS